MDKATQISESDCTPNLRLGYPCINVDLRKKGVLTSRTLREATFREKGLEYVKELVEANLRDLKRILEWNNANGIRFFRLSSDIFPHITNSLITDCLNQDCGVYEPCAEDLPRPDTPIERAKLPAARPVKRGGKKKAAPPSEPSALRQRAKERVARIEAVWAKDLYPDQPLYDIRFCEAKLQQ
jgi:hypothetical protein